MSKISLTPNASGTGNFTIASPNSNTDRTLTLPDSTGTVVVTSGAQTIEFADGSASTPSITNSGDTNTGMFFPAADTIAFAEGGVEAMRLDSSGRLIVQNGPVGAGQTSSTKGVQTYFDATNNIGYIYSTQSGVANYRLSLNGNDIDFNQGLMRLDSSGNLLVGTTDSSPAGNNGTGISLETFGSIQCSRSGGTTIQVNRKTNDGDLMSFRQDGTTEGTISVSGTTVSYNGGHLSRWSQWQNETGKPNVYRGTILESTNDMCEWEKDGEPLPNEQATKTIVSTTVASKAVAGVFDRYDEDDETNPYDFYVAQSGDFVIRIAQGVIVQNGDLLESAGDGTAKPQADDICRSSTVAKVTSNYVSATYEDGSYCVPCILMIG